MGRPILRSDGGLCGCFRYDPLSWEFPSWAAITGPAVNILKGGVAVADRVVTVSQVTAALTDLMQSMPGQS